MGKRAVLTSFFGKRNAEEGHHGDEGRIDVDNLSADEFRTKLEQRGFPTTGSKTVLRERLRGALEENNPDDDDEAEDIDLLTVAQPKDQLRNLDLKISGNKNVLCTRLKAALIGMNKENDEEENESVSNHDTTRVLQQALNFKDVEDFFETFSGDDLFGVPILTVHDVDPCIEENGENHRTSKYELMTRRDDRARLVVRRGQAFYLHVSRSRHFCSFIDEMSIVFILDGIKRPQYGDGTMVATTLLHPGEISKTAWQANIDPIDHRLLRIKIVPPADAIIGKWKIKINTKYKPTEETASYTMDHPFYLIYNPWCKDEVHYLKGEDERQEYVLMEDGLIWLGNRKDKRRIKWKYAQFDQDILDIALYLMNQVCKVRVSDRNNTFVIIRCLTAAVNSNIDNGVVVGSWGGYYKGGTPPTWWTGSQKILQEYYKTKEPVKYGQCWVYAGVLTTICRTLGIPCRPVTNYLSAYDSDTDIKSDTDTYIEIDTKESLTVDYFMNAESQIKRKDFIWNFHVWNEVWMKRLFPDYSGWQVIDATPQELSDGSDRIGPTSVAAVKKGEIVFPYNTAFLYYKTNADKVSWLYDGPARPLKIIGTDRHSIGQLISTKAVGKWSREDITHTYKYPEGSDEERAATRKVLRQSKSLLNRYYLNEEFDDVMFTFKRDDIIIGQPFSVVLLVKNRSSIMECRVFVLLRVEMVLYTGQVGKSTEKTYFGKLARPGELLETRLDISWEKYSPRLLDQCNFINITFFTTVLDVDMKYNVQDDFYDSFIIKLEKSRSNSE